MVQEIGRVDGPRLYSQVNTVAAEVDPQSTVNGGVRASPADVSVSGERTVRKESK